MVWIVNLSKSGVSFGFSKILVCGKKTVRIMSRINGVGIWKCSCISFDMLLAWWQRAFTMFMKFFLYLISFVITRLNSPINASIFFLALSVKKRMTRRRYLGTCVSARFKVREISPVVGSQ